MKVLLLAINSKYIHPNLAVRLLARNTDYPVEIKEFTIKDDPSNVVNFVNETAPDVLGISCYIWNIEIVKRILPRLGAKIKILGGPEVSYDAEYYLKKGLSDYVIKNEGEVAFDRLLKYIDGKIPLCDVPNVYYLKNGEPEFTFDYVADVKNLKPAYDLYDDPAHKISYIETSRGCPYHCAYCMASLDNNLRFFDAEEIKNEITALRNRGAKTFKFLDRTFNANKKFLDLLKYIIENHTEGESYQFEITGDILKDDYVDFINENAPKNLIRFEIGIQTTHEASNVSVSRCQDNAKLFKTIRKIQDGGVIDLHLDLICGLPYETYDLFKHTFNECLELRPKELQLGFLKLLKGTKLYKEADRYGYVYSQNAPYEIISNDFLSENDVSEIRFAENAFDHYYNRGIFRSAMMTVLDNATDYFEFFRALGKCMEKGNLEEQFRLLDDFVKDKPYYEAFHKSLIFDYLDYFNVKPKAWWNENIDAKKRKALFRKICDTETDCSLDDCLRHGMLIELKDEIIVGVWTSKKKIIKYYSEIKLDKTD